MHHIRPHRFVKRGDQVRYRARCPTCHCSYTEDVFKVLVRCHCGAEITATLDGLIAYGRA